MALSEEKRFALGIPPFATLLCIAAYVVVILLFLSALERELADWKWRDFWRGHKFFPSAVNYFIAIGVTLALAVVADLVTIVAYLIHAINDKRPHASQDRIQWIVLIVVTGVIGQLIYYFLRIRTDVPPEPPRRPRIHKAAPRSRIVIRK